MNRISRRTFLVEATSAAGTALAARSLPAAAAQSPALLLASTLAPAQEGPLHDVARNRLAHQSSAADNDHTAHLVTDGSAETYWQSAPGGEPWITIDFGRPLPLEHLTLLWGDVYPSTYALEISPANAPTPTQWRPVHQATQGTGQREQIPLPNMQARHIRLRAVSPNPDRGIILHSLQAWSSIQTAPPSPRPPALAHNSLLNAGWTLQVAQFTRAAPETIASPDFLAPDWLPATVPGTVLASYLALGAIPDPRFGNGQTEVSEAFFTGNNTWYRNRFTLARSCRGRRLWLVFNGINWKADVYLNGTLLGTIAGAFTRARFDLTAHARLGKTNCVAVLIHKVAHPGPVQHKRLGGSYSNGGILGLDSPTFLASIGWNWVPTIRGRNTGIWNDVHFQTGGDVTFVDPWVTSTFPDDPQRLAHLTFCTELRNHADHATRITLHLTLEQATFSKQLILHPREIRSLTVDSTEWPHLAVRNPRLWWPNGYGDSALYTLHARVDANNIPSYEQDIPFGIRHLEFRNEHGILTCFVNGHRILLRGGNWGMEDGMLMCDAAGYDLRVRLHRDMHLNMIRNWVGMVGRDAFYEACDRHGILIWDDFWLANPSDGPDPADNALFLANVRDKIRRVRHHPSLALYCGRNEGDPPPVLNAGMRDAIQELDGARYYLPASASGLVTGHGPYDNQEPAWYFEHRGLTFHSEQGIVCVPPVESMRAMMPEADLWPISDTWAVHDYQNPRSVLYTKRLAARYGDPTGIDDYCRKAQLANLETAKAIFECLQSHQGSGQLLWMSQSAWPALLCQLYDFYFEPTGAYFGAKIACRPLHVLWDQHTNQIKAANNTITARSGLQVHAALHDLQGHLQWQQATTLDLPATTAVPCFPFEAPPNIGDVFFLILKLTDGPNILSENTYWSPREGQTCQSLNTLSPTSVQLTAALSASTPEPTITATLSNPGTSPAFALRLNLVDRNGERVLPAIYEDNYLLLLPAEQKTLTIELPHHPSAPQGLRIQVEGWNVPRTEAGIQPHTAAGGVDHA